MTGLTHTRLLRRLPRLRSHPAGPPRSVPAGTQARFGLDSTSMVPVAAHRAVGSSVALRYLSRFSRKVLTAGETAAYRAGGIDVVTVFEDFADNALSGFARGVADAKFALWQAGTLGLPVGRPIFFAVDFDETPGQAGVVLQYFRGVNSVLGVGRTGCYGGYWVVKRLFDAGVIRYGWQTYAWSGGNFDKRSQCFQYSNSHFVAGVGVDYNHLFGADFGQWWYKPKPAPEVADPQGVWEAKLKCQMPQGKWTVEALPGQNVRMGGHNRRWRVEVSVGEQHGDWDHKPLSFG